MYLIQNLVLDKCKMIPICTHFNKKALLVTPYLISNDVTTMQLMVVEVHESFMTEYTSHFIHVYIMSTSVCNHINSLRVTWHILTSRSPFWIVLFGEQKLYKTRTTRTPAFWDTPRCLMITHTSEERCTLARAGCVRTRTAGSACRKPFTLVRVLVLNPEKISLAGSYAIWVRRGQNENRTLDLLKIRLSHQISCKHHSRSMLGTFKH